MDELKRLNIEHKNQLFTSFANDNFKTIRDEYISTMEYLIFILKVTNNNFLDINIFIYTMFNFSIYFNVVLYMVASSVVVT